MKRFGKKCNYCRDRFANHLNRKIHETMMHKEKLIRDGIKPVPVGKDSFLYKDGYEDRPKSRDSKYHKPLVFSTTPHIGSVETVIEGDGTICINPTKKYPKGKVYVWSHVHGYCTRDPCLFCGRGDLTEIKKEWGIKDD